MADSRLKRIHFLFKTVLEKQRCIVFLFFFNILKSYHQKKGVQQQSHWKVYTSKTLQFFEHELTCEVMNCPFCGGKMENCRHRYEGIPRGRSHGSMPSCELMKYMKSGSLRQCELFY